ncbi:MAG: hypothetical protein FWD24_01180 [Treponema sp.]|nr:hypothetical protein [Treponema sp.]
MNNETNFANGFDYFCENDGIFFSVQYESDLIDSVEMCPYCGGDNLLRSIDEFLEYLEDNNTDPVNFYKVFPPDELIPNSRTGATPRQVSMIISLVSMRSERSIPITVESVAGNCNSCVEIIRKVFKELHITEAAEDK